jgi:deoxyribodipyrimidine photolyase-related protein
MTTAAPKILRLILGDQLNINHSWFNSVDNHILYVMMEVRQETDYTLHHVQKVLAFFASMRRFAEDLRSNGHTIKYIALDDPENTQSFAKNLLNMISAGNVTEFQYQLPDEYRLDVQLKEFCSSLSIPSRSVDSEHFLTERDDLKKFFTGKKQYIMESFYRDMRKRHDILMDSGKPAGGVWNFDKENRGRYDGAVSVPPPMEFNNDISHIRRLIDDHGVKTFGHSEDRLLWPIDREQSLQLLNDFIADLLPCFGTYQDAMALDHWSLFHSRLSFSLNTKMLQPHDIVKSAIQAWEDNKRSIGLQQVEGFVRQIIGWREYMRGVYWARMPEYSTLNFFDHTAPLPHYYWDGDTKMQCMRAAIGQSLEKAYAHHIQRLMITGNFALLAGIDPDDVDAWYLGVYIDAIEWVEITNTRGMSQFADGGIVGTKPYVSSSNYINKMSDYCTDCHYKSSLKYGDRACPFNSMYWHFLERHRDRLSKNPRMGMMYRVLDRYNDTERKNIIAQAREYLNQIEAL